MAEARNSLFKAELVRNKGPWRDIEHLEVAVAEYLDWSTTASCTPSPGWSPPSSTRPATTPARPRRHSPRRENLPTSKPALDTHRGRPGPRTLPR